MTQRREKTPAPGLLEAFAQEFDPLFTKWNQREGFRRYLEGLLLPAERNKTLTGARQYCSGHWRPGSAGAEPPVVLVRVQLG